MSSANDLYAQRGVSADKQDVHKAIAHLDKGLYPNAFCKILPDVAGDPAWCSLLHADTAGTKTVLAYLYWKETGNLDVWKGIVQDAIVMNLDDMACAGVLNGFVLSNTIGRNKSVIPGEVVAALIGGATEFAAQMAALGIEVTLAGGETADVGDIVRTADVGFTALARLPRAQVKSIDILPGDVIVGLASDGQATYETSYNSGIGSNGLTFARHELLDKHYAEAYPESFDPALDRHVLYTGRHRLTDQVESLPVDIGQAILSPTRTYVPVLNALPKELWPLINGIIHCTGGGQSKVLHFTKEGLRIVKDNLLDVPPLFRLIQYQNNSDWENLFKVFNMGQRLEFYIRPEGAQAIIDTATRFGVRAQITGRVEKWDGPSEVRLTNPVTSDIYHYVRQ